MTKQVQRRRGTATQHTSFTGAEGEISVNTTNKSAHVHDGVTAGGFELARKDLNNVTTSSVASKVSGGTISTIDLNGGTIDNTVIGGSSAAAGTFTTVTASGDVTIADKIVHSGDTNTAIRFPAADTVTVETSGAERLRIDSSGNVGIGTAAPSSKLDVVSTGTTAETIAEFGNANISNGLTIQTNGNLDWGFNATNSRNLTFSTNQTERIRIDSSGNVGIGTNSPSTYGGKLAIVGAALGGETTLVLSNTNTSQFLRMGINADVAQIAYDNADALAFGIANSSTDAGLTTEYMRITSAGNVGIGTSSPRSKADVAGTLTVGDANPPTVNLYRNVALASASSAGIMNFGGRYDATNYATGAQISGLTIGTWSSTNYGASLLFSTVGSGSTTLTERMRIDSSGNVGIGTSSPATLGSNVTTVTVNGTSGGGIQFQRTDATATTGLVAAFSGAFALGSVTSTDVTFRTGNTERMRIDSSGNVGIGTSSPGTLLHLYGSATAGADTVLRVQNGNTDGAGILGFGDTGDSFIGGIQYDHANDSMNFFVNNSYRMAITSSGNVLIGDTQARATVNSTGTTALTPTLQQTGTSENSSSIGLFNYSTSTVSDPAIAFSKSLNATIGSHTAVTSGTQLGGITWNGSDGSAFVGAANILVLADANASSGSLPGRIEFETTGTGGTSPTTRMTIDSAGAVTMTGDVSAANLLSGTYTPTLTAVANVTSSTAYVTQYLRVGSVVTVSGHVALVPTSANTDTQLRMTIPVASNFGTQALGGAGASVSTGIFGEPVAITSDTTNDEATFRCRPTTTSGRTYAFSFTYRII